MPGRYPASPCLSSNPCPRLSSMSSSSVVVLYDHNTFQVVILLLRLLTTTLSLPSSPHLVVVLVDSWSSGSTPLMEEGILLPSYYSPPIKGAALTSILSGKYPHKRQAITSDSLSCSLLLGGLLRYFLQMGGSYKVFHPGSLVTMWRVSKMQERL